MDVFTWLILIVAALITSIISGFLGMAGGISLLSVMTAVLPAPMVVPLHGVVQLASNATRTAVYIPHVRWKIFGIFIGPLVIGMLCATAVWSGDKLTLFKPGIGIFVLTFLAYRRRGPKARNLPMWTYAPLGVVTGFLSIFVGATGPFLAPFFLREDLKKEEIIATKAVCQAATHLMKLPAFLSLGFDYQPHLPLLGGLILAVVIGTSVGRMLLGKISQQSFLRLFELVLAVIALYLIASPFLR